MYIKLVINKFYSFISTYIQIIYKHANGYIYTYMMSAGADNVSIYLTSQYTSPSPPSSHHTTNYVSWIVRIYSVSPTWVRPNTLTPQHTCLPLGISSSSSQGTHVQISFLCAACSTCVHAVTQPIRIHYIYINIHISVTGSHSHSHWAVDTGVITVTLSRLVVIQLGPHGMLFVRTFRKCVSGRLSCMPPKSLVVYAIS